MLNYKDPNPVINPKTGLPFSSHPYTRLVCMGFPGSGKSSVLYYIKSLLDKANIPNVIITKLPTSLGTLQTMKGVPDFDSLRPDETLYILLDHPDEIDASEIKPFLRSIWTAISEEKIARKIQFIFAMNQSHYALSFNYSEILGKFEIYRFEPLSKEEVTGIILARLSSVHKNVLDVFDDDVLDIIHKYTCGNARNVLTICNKLYDKASEGQKISKEMASPILREEYPTLVIENRANDPQLIPIYRKVIELMNAQPDKSFPSKELLVKELIRATEKGRNTCLNYVNDLVRWGLIEEKRGGVKRSNRILTLTFKKGVESI